MTNLKLARGLTPLLFNPPPWNLAAIPTPELIQAWPEGIDADQQELLLNLLAYHIFPLAGEKRSILERMGSLSKSQVAKLIESLSRERHQWLSITGENYWELLHLTLIAGIEWLVLLTQIGSNVRSGVIGDQDVERAGLRVNSQTVTSTQAVLRDLVAGNPSPQSAFSSHPLFPLLVAESIRASSEQPGALLPKWLQAAKLDPTELRTRLTEQACRQVATDEFSSDVQGHCWERRGGALVDHGRATAESVRAECFDRAIVAFERSLSLRPDDADTLSTLGQAFADRGWAAAQSERAEWLDRAIATYERSLSARPDDAGTLNNLTATLVRKWCVVHDDAEKSQILEAADRHIQKAMSIQPDTARYNSACVLAVQGRGDEAMGELRRLLASHPEQREQVARDEDFASIANRPEFRELLGHDGQSK